MKSSKFGLGLSGKQSQGFLVFQYDRHIGKREDPENQANLVDLSRSFL